MSFNPTVSFGPTAVGYGEIRADIELHQPRGEQAFIAVVGTGG